MTCKFAFVLWLLPVVSAAQAPRAVDQQLLTELKGIRAALERLETSQNLLIALTSIQIDESRIASLEAQRLQLSAREQELGREAERAGAAVRSLERGSGGGAVQTATGSGESTAGVDPGPFRAQLSQATRRAEEATRARQSIEQTIAALRSRIAALEKRLEGAAR